MSAAAPSSSPNGAESASLDAVDSRATEVESYEKAFDVSTQTAVSHLEVQGRGVEIVEQLESAEGASYAGVWFDNEAGNFVVPVLDSRNLTSVNDALGEDKLDGDYRIVSADYSWQELEATHGWIDKALNDPIESQQVQTSLDPRTNAVVIYEADGTNELNQEQIKDLVTEARVNVDVRHVPVERFDSQTLACTQSPVRACDKPLRAGVYIDWAGTHEYACTAGFKVLGNVYANRFVLTAGHCYKGSADWASRESKNYSYYLGHVEEGTYPGGDWAKIRVNGSGFGEFWDEAPWVSSAVYWGGNQNLPIEHESSSYLGQLVCYSGERTGSGCGYVTAFDVTQNYGDGNVYHLTKAAGLYASEGDSGGPVWAGNTALGLISGGIPGNDPTYFAEITDATNSMGVHVGTATGAPPSAETAVASAVQPHQATGNGKVDPNGLSTTYHFDYGTTTGFGSSTEAWGAGSGWGASAVSGIIPNLQPATTYFYRLVASNSAGTSYGGAYGFTTPPGPPIASTSAAIGIAGGGATLQGTVNPQGADTHYWFEWGVTTKYGHEVPVPHADIGSGISNVAVSNAISGIKGNTTYHFRVVASNQEGVSQGVDQQFTTPNWRPAVTSEEATEIAGRKATLHGSVNPEGFDTHYHFEWGATEGNKFDHNVPIPDADVGSSTGDVPVGQAIEGIKGLTGYHYRIYAYNAEGSTTSAVQSFTTPDWRPAATTGVASDVRLHRGTLNGTVNPHSLGTTYQFEYLSDASCQVNMEKAGKEHCFDGAASVPVVAEDIGSGSKDINLSKTIEGLEPWLSYDYRIVASNVEATTYGERMTFVTNGKWTLEAPPDPKASNSSTLADLSCTSQISCLAVGYDGYAGHSLGEFWNGTKWTLIGGAGDQFPGAISCGSTTSCWAVGSKFSDGSPLVQRWYQEEGQWESYASTKLLTPAGGTNVHVKGIDCTAATECTAVGYYTKEGHNRVLAERLKSSTWTLQSTPEVTDAVLEDIACTSASACTAVGYRSGAVLEPFAGHWDGEKWSTVSVPSPAGKGWELLRLNAVSCTSATSCVATGNFADEEFEEGLPFAATYNGSKFTLTSMPKLKEGARLADLSCTSSTACLAVGQNSGGSSTLALAWNGSEWAVQASPTPAGKTAWLTGVSCNAPLACTVAGWDYGGGEWLTLAERWE